MDRTPPPNVRKALREEVGFGCPVADCDSPYLSWHHFDPPWSEREHHEPDGMIALCVLHHGQADQGAFTKDQLRHLKDPDHNDRAKRLRGMFHWRRDRLVLLAGGNWWVGCEVLLKCGSIPIIWLTRDPNGYELLNLDLFDEHGVPRLQMRDNDWVTYGQLSDLECPPKKAALTIETGELGAKLTISFSRATRDLVRNHALDVARRSDQLMPDWVRERVAAYRLPSPEERADERVAIVLEDVPEDDSALCAIHGRLRWPVDIRLELGQIFLPGNNTLSDSVMKGGVVGIQIG